MKLPVRKIHCLNRPLRYLAVTAGTFLLAAQVLASSVVNINTADAKTIADSLQGIGPVKAQAIVDYREANGLFKSTDDILNVTGIGKATFELLKSYLTVGTPAGKSNATSSLSPGSTPVLTPVGTRTTAKALASSN